MITLPANASDNEILYVVRRWVDLLANGEFDEAQALLIRDGAERDWPPELVAELIISYELPPAVDTGEKARVTKIGDARVADIHPHPFVARWEKSGRPGVIGDVHFDLPINGIWSDLTAIFFLRQVAEGLALELFDIHVL